MKKRLIFLLVISIALVTFISCGKETIGETPVCESQSIETKKPYVKPTKNEFTQEDRQIIDKYYQEMILLYPQFEKIPKEMLQESLSRISDNKYLNVSFTFCFGGIRTECQCTYSTSPKYPQGHWEIKENEFSRFYQSGLDESVMSQIRSTLSKGVSGYIDSYHLEKAELSDKNLPLYWQITDGKIFACCEHIANITPSTTKKYGCGDHAHVFGKILVELSDETVQLTAFPVTGD